MFSRIRHLEPGRPMSPGVAALVEYLDRSLDQAWRILVHPSIDGVRLDVVVFQALVGLTIFEVSELDAPPDPDTPEAPYRCRVEGGLVIPRVSLSARAEFARDTLVRLMADFAGDGIPDSSSVALIRTVAYVPGASTQELAGVSEAARSRTPYFGADALTPTHLARIVPGAHRQRRGNWNPAWNDLLMYWLQPPHHEPERQHPLGLTSEQRRLVQPQPGHRGLRGPVGSGKTRVLAWRAASLASEGKQVLVVCATPVHRHNLRAIMDRVPLAFPWHAIVVTDLDNLCRGLILEAGAALPDLESAPDSDRSKRLASAAREVLDRVPHRRHDAVLVDEGQAMHLEGYLLLAGMLTERDELLLVHDDPADADGLSAEDPTWLDRAPARDVSRFSRRWGRLTSVHARPLEIAWGAMLFGAIHGLEVPYPNLLELREARDRAVPGLTFEWRSIQAALWFEELVASIKALAFERARPEDVTVLFPEPVRGLSEALVIERLKGDFDRFFDLAEHPYPTRRVHRASGRARLEASHVFAFEDWDRSEVVLLIPEYHAATDSLDGLVYTVLSRAHRRVHVLDAGSRYRDFMNVLFRPRR